MAVALEAARGLKHALTDAPEAVAMLGQVEFALGRPEFDALIEPLLDRAGRACRRALQGRRCHPGPSSTA